MDDELLADILAAERKIRQQIETLEEQTRDRLESLKKELDRRVDDESGLLQAELEQARTRTVQAAEKEAATLLTEARAYAKRFGNLDIAELDRVVLRHLPRICPEGADDRQNEQA